MQPERTQSLRKCRKWPEAAPRRGWTTAEFSRPSDLEGVGDGDKNGRKKIVGKKIIGAKTSWKKEADAPVLSRRGQERGDGDAGDETGPASQRTERQEGNQPEAGDCDRTLQGAQGRQESAGEDELAWCLKSPWPVALRITSGISLQACAGRASHVVRRVRAFESRVSGDEVQVYKAGGPIALLGEDDLRLGAV
jgi:hypothetical protein